MSKLKAPKEPNQALDRPISTFHGASERDWLTLFSIPDLSTELLPVVSNLSATISPRSTIKQLGKTPSCYNKEREVVGQRNWTRQKSSLDHIKRWATEPDYGICIQTRILRALDIDIDDKEIVQHLLNIVHTILGHNIPYRYRDNSAKLLVPFFLPGELRKRQLVSAHGAIELLANGQQFVAIGTHPSGARYRWANGNTFQFPTLSHESLETLWATLNIAINSSDTRYATRDPADPTPTTKITDPVVAYLKETNRHIGHIADGKIIIQCPWEDEHTAGETGDTSTVWLPAGLMGYDQGNFKCLHAHCASRTTADYLEAISYRAQLSTPFSPIKSEATTFRLPFRNPDKKGVFPADRTNLIAALLREDLCRHELRFDTFTQQIMIKRPDNDHWRPLEDTDYMQLALELENGANGFLFKPISKELIRDVTHYVAHQTSYDSAQDWLRQIEWDGQQRVNRFLTAHFGTEENDYHEAISRYIWTALAGRVLNPGSKVDMVPIAVGAQGLGKSSVVAAIAPDPDSFSELDLGMRDSDFARLIRGKLVVELGELKGLRVKEVAQIKQMITRRFEEWIPKYQENKTRYPRRCLFIGTTNETEFLTDDTGNRRWLPFHVGQCSPELTIKDRDQLWAEGRELYLEDGILYHAAEELSVVEHDSFFLEDPWTAQIAWWLTMKLRSHNTKRESRQALQLHASEILIDALELSPKEHNAHAHTRLKRVMRSLGITQQPRRVNGQSKRLYLIPHDFKDWRTQTVQPALSADMIRMSNA